MPPTGLLKICEVN